MSDAPLGARLAWARVPIAAIGATPIDGRTSRTGFSGWFRPDENRLHQSRGNAPLGTPSRRAEREYEPVPVTRYSHLPPRERPTACCPDRLERVRFKPGRRMRHHSAHREESRCAAAGGEEALLPGVKMHLAEQSGSAITIDLEHRCHGAATDVARYGCRRRLRTPCSVEWDEIRVELSMRAVRSDVLLLSRGRPVAAVFATSAVDDERARRHAGLDVPYVEAPAESLIGRGRPFFE